MRGAIPPLPNTSSWCGAYLSTGTLPYVYLKKLTDDVNKFQILDTSAESSEGALR